MNAKHLITPNHTLTEWRKFMSDDKKETPQPEAPANQSGYINPSAPNDSNITPGSDYEQPKTAPKANRAQSGN
jgi:hypothetical protein